MKKIFKTLLTLTLAAMFCFVFASCQEHEHVGEWTTSKEPTCTVAGEQTRTCTDCGETQTKDIPAKGHTPGEEATCTTTQNCTVCNAVVTPALGHTAGAAATCTEAQTCTVCNAVVTPALGHTAGAAATCTEAQTCTVCNAEVKAALGHTEVVDAAIAPTCTEAGKTEGKHCSVCNEVLVAQTEVAALGHTEVIDAAVAPTCTETGKTEGKHCSVCNEVLVAQTEVAALGHTEVVDAAAAPTCTETGKTEGKHCSVCNEVLVAQTEVAALGHTEVVDAAVVPTCTEAGKTEGKHCSVCNEVLVLQEIVEALGHTEVVDAAVAPTCTEAGKTEGKHCSVCNEILAIQEEVAALGHTEVITPEVPATPTATGWTEGKHCSTCNEILVEQMVIERTVFARFDFGTHSKAQTLGMTSHDYLVGALTYDTGFINVDYNDDAIIVTALQNHPELTFNDDGAENPNGYSVTSYALCFENLEWGYYEFGDELKRDKGFMKVRIKNNTSNNIMAFRFKGHNHSAYATTLLASCMYLQGGAPTMADYEAGNNRLTCEPSAEYGVYTYDINFLATLGRAGSRKEDRAQSYAHFAEDVANGGSISSNNWNWLSGEVCSLQFFVLGAYGGSSASERAYFTYADTRTNIVEGATVEIDYIIFGTKDGVNDYTSYIEDVYNESVSISKSISESISLYESAAASAVAG